jgi:RecA-family ATPase
MTTIDFDDFEQQHATEAIEPFPYVLARDITLVPKAFLIDGFVGMGETSAWYGPPDGGKSTVALDAGCHVAAGLDYYGRPVTQGAVLYIAVERGAVVHRRVRAWGQHHAHMDIPLAVVAEMIDLRTGRLHAERIIAAARKLSEACGSPLVSLSTPSTAPLRAGTRTAARTWAQSLQPLIESSGQPTHTVR